MAFSSSQEAHIHCPFCASPQSKRLTIATFIRKHLYRHQRDPSTSPNLMRDGQGYFRCPYQDCRIALPHLKFFSYLEIVNHIEDHFDSYERVIKHLVTPEYQATLPSVTWLWFGIYSPRLECWFTSATIMDYAIAAIGAETEYLRNPLIVESWLIPREDIERPPSFSMMWFQYLNTDWKMRFDQCDEYIIEEAQRIKTETDHRQLISKYDHLKQNRMQICHDSDDESDSSSSSCMTPLAEDGAISFYVRKDGSLKTKFRIATITPDMRPENVIK